MKILALALASAQAYTVFDIGADCTADGATPCGTNEICGEDLKVSRSRKKLKKSFFQVRLCPWLGSSNRNSYNLRCTN